MSKRILETLFDSKPRVKILKFLFRNTDQPFTVRDVARHTQESSATVRRELNRLVEIKLLRQRS